MEYKSETSNLRLAVLTACTLVFCWFVATFWIYIACAVVIYAMLFRRPCGYIHIQGQGVFITGCDTGFGHDLARRLDELGFTVFAGCFKPDGQDAKLLKSSTSKSLHVIPLDVRDDNSVKAAHDYIVQHLPNKGLWAIVNNAGMNFPGDVEVMSVDMYNKVMNVNFYGYIRTIRQCLYLVRKTKALVTENKCLKFGTARSKEKKDIAGFLRKPRNYSLEQAAVTRVLKKTDDMAIVDKLCINYSGRVVNVSSVMGVISWPRDSLYQATKASVERLTDALRLEMQKFGVHVSKVLPGSFGRSTAISTPDKIEKLREGIIEKWNNATTDVKVAYSKNYLLGRLNLKEVDKTKFSTSNKPVIDAMVDSLISEKPQAVYIVDGVNGLIDRMAALARYQQYLPTWLSDMIVNKLTNCHRFPEK